eukprot:SAG11_NODE_81_length_17673_cov_7.702572_3_plen_73_part_00
MIVPVHSARMDTDTGIQSKIRESIYESSIENKVAQTNSKIELDNVEYEGAKVEVQAQQMVQNQYQPGSMCKV